MIFLHISLDLKAYKSHLGMIFTQRHNAALRCERRLAILERSESAKRCESLLNALLCDLSHWLNVI